MFLFKRKGYYHLDYFDEVENRPRRTSTKCKVKQDALKFVANFKDELKAKNKAKFNTLKQFNTEYLTYVKSTLSKGYYKNVEFSFKLLTEKFGDDAVLRKITARQVEFTSNG